MRRRYRLLGGAVVVLTLAVVAAASHAGQPLETESATILPRGTWELEGTAEYQVSNEGTERALPLAVGYGISGRLELLVEPVFYTAIRPTGGTPATGLGDVEVTLTGVLRRVTPRHVGVALAVEQKLPTARNLAIGTGRADETVSVLLTRLGPRVAMHVNAGYAFIGRIPGVPLRNTWNGALAAEYHATPRLDWAVEVLGVTAASAVPTSGEAVRHAGTATGAAEIGGAEIIGMVGMRYLVDRTVSLAFGVTVDNNGAVLFRPGVSMTFPHF